MSIALALGGGAGLGWAHIGVLRALERAGIAVAAVAGTSAGALAGVAFAAGELDALEALALSATPGRVVLFLDPNLRRGAVLGGRGIAARLRAHLGERRLEDLAIPSAAVAADLVTGERVVIARGPAEAAVRASIAIPGVFRPVALDGRLLVDGGALDPVPVAAARALSDRPVVAINLQGDYRRRVAAVGIGAPATKLTAAKVTRAGLAMALGELARLSLALEPPDALLELAVGHVAISRFTLAAELIAIGEAAVAERLDELRALSAASLPK